MWFDENKWACTKCVDGHRVSMCKHPDRLVQFVRRKGRPPSQCPHCRHARKSKASHNKCKCRDKPHGKGDCEDVEHVDHSREREPTLFGRVVDNHVVSQYICWCEHGENCFCALNAGDGDLTSFFDPATELEMPERPVGLHRSTTSESRNPRLATARSDGPLTVFANGHHKPVHRFNHAAHESGAPYKIPRPSSVYGPSSVARSSMESLPSLFSGIQDERLVRSEHGSPSLRPVSSFDDLTGQWPQLDVSYLYPNNITSSPIGDGPTQPYNNVTTSPAGGEDMASPYKYQSYTSNVATSPSGGEDLNSQVYNSFDSFVPTPDDQTYFPAPEGQPFVSMPDAQNSQSSFFDWSAFDQDIATRPELTTSSSDEISELGDPLSHDLPSPGGISYSNPDPVMNSYRMSSGSNYFSTSQASLLRNTNIEKLNFDHFLPGSDSPSADLGDFNSADSQINRFPFTPPHMTVQDAQKLAHPVVPIQAMSELSMPRTTTPDLNNDLGWPAPDLYTGPWGEEGLQQPRVWGS